MSGEKTEQPTEQKLEESAKKGQVAQRKNVVETGTITFAAIYISTTWSTLADDVIAFFEVSFSTFDGELADRLAIMQPLAANVIWYGIYFAMGSAMFGLFLTLLLNKFNFAPKAMEPKFEKFNPVSGFKQIFSMNTLYNFIRLMILFSCASLLLYLVIDLNLRDGLSASYCGLPCLIDFFPTLFLQLALGLIAISAILAAADFRIQNALHTKQNKMSKHDVKREHISSEGNPMIKGRRSSLAYQDANLPGMRDVTHVVFSSDALIAMRFDKKNPDLPPFVILKVRDDLVPDMLEKFKTTRAKCINSTSIAVRFYQNVEVGNYVQERGSMDAAKILHLAKDI